MAQISAKNLDFWYMDGSLFLQNGYLDGWHFKNPSGTPLPRPKLSTPPGFSWYRVAVIDIEYNKRLDRQRPCLEGDFSGGSNDIVQSNKSV